MITDTTSIITLLLDENNNYNLKYSELIERYPLCRFQEKEVEKSKMTSIIETMVPFIRQANENKAGNRDDEDLLKDLQKHKERISGMTLKYKELRKKHAELEKKYEFLLNMSMNMDD